MEKTITKFKNDKQIGMCRLTNKCTTFLMTLSREQQLQLFRRADIVRNALDPTLSIDRRHRIFPRCREEP